MVLWWGVGTSTLLLRTGQQQVNCVNHTGKQITISISINKEQRIARWYGNKFKSIQIIQGQGYCCSGNSDRIRIL